MPVFSVETYDQIISDLKPMLKDHWQELAVHKDIVLDPDFVFYENAHKAGLIQILTARLNGELIGYAVFVVRIHPHYKNNSWASNDLIWLHPDWRNLGFGREFIGFIDREFKRRGVDVIHINEKTSSPALGMLLKSVGYVAVEVGYEKRI